MLRSVALVVLILCAGAVTGRTEVVWEAGFKGGVGFGKLIGDTAFDETVPLDGVTMTITGNLDGYRTGFNGVGFVTARLNRRFGLRLEALFSQKGGQGDFTFEMNAGGETFFGHGEQTYKLSYLELPLLAVGTFDAGTRTQIDIFAGPVLATKTSATLAIELEMQIDGEVLEDEDESDIGDDIAGTDFGFTVGAGLTILAHPKAHVVIDGRYVHGLKNIPDTEEDFDLKNTNIVLMAGLSFPFGTGTGH